MHGSQPHAGAGPMGGHATVGRPSHMPHCSILAGDFPMRQQCTATPKTQGTASTLPLSVHRPCTERHPKSQTLLFSGTGRQGAGVGGATQGCHRPKAMQHRTLQLLNAHPQPCAP